MKIDEMDSVKNFQDDHIVKYFYVKLCEYPGR